MDMHLLISYAVLYIAAKIGKKLLEKIGNPVVQKCLKYAEDPIGEYVVARIINYPLAPIGCLLCYNRNMKDLRTRLGKLRTIRYEVRGLVDAAERNGEVVLPRVQKWQKSAIEITRDSMKLLVNNPQLNLMVRCQQSKSAKEKTSEVDQLIQKGNSFDRVSTFRSRIFAMEEIMEALKDDRISRTGIHGASGVGKTTLVKEIGEEAKDSNLFDEVVMAKVSSDPNLERIQCEIADILGLRFDENNDAGRARRLFQRLEGKKRILIILDDISKKVDLEDIGIPCDGCKIVLVSRSQDECHQSGAEKYFPIEALSEDEGWKLFRRTVGDSVDSQDLYPKPAEVAKRCAGSPMLIVEAARAFKKRGKWSEVFKSIHLMPSVDKAKSSNSSLVGSIGVIDGRNTMADSLSQLKTFDLGKPSVDEAKSSPRPSVDEARRPNNNIVGIGPIYGGNTIAGCFPALKTFKVVKPSVDEAKSSPRPSVDEARRSNNNIVGIGPIYGGNTIAGSFSTLTTFNVVKPSVDEAKSSPRPSVDEAKRSPRPSVDEVFS